MTPEKTKSKPSNRLPKVFSEEDEELRNDLKHTCLEIVKSDIIKPAKYVTTNKRSSQAHAKNWLEICNEVSVESLEAYKEWKKNNSLESKSLSKIPKVDVNNLLILLHVLKISKVSSESDAHIRTYLRRMRFHGVEQFWGTPALVHLAFRHCILTRNWDKMTLFCIILLKQNNKAFYSSVRKMCRIMMQFNPLIKNSDLYDQFAAQTKTRVKYRFN